MSDMKDLLKKALPQADETALDRFEIYHRLLSEWNEKMNLTAITDPVAVAEKHFADSLAALPYLKPGMKVVDVGTGAGFPGVPLLIMEPGLELTLADSLQKRLTFLDALLKELGLKAALVHGRAEDLGQNKLYREQFDAALSRAVANLPVLLELTTPFVRVGGTAMPRDTMFRVCSRNPPRVAWCSFTGLPLGFDDFGIVGRCHDCLLKNG